MFMAVVNHLMYSSWDMLDCFIWFFWCIAPDMDKPYLVHITVILDTFWDTAFSLFKVPINLLIRSHSLMLIARHYKEIWLVTLLSPWERFLYFSFFQ